MSLVGRNIGRYRILEQLGQGGMSVVYKGLDTALEREVAVKVLHPHLSGKEESRRRLAREARAVAKLRHPNILEVYDFAGLDAEDAYIVTELIRGQTLRQYAAVHSFDPPEIAAMVVHEIASALAHAHDAGVIHRDLKPENVMVREDGVLKLMDFGIAKIVDRDEKMTMTGALVGSPAHMAPEIIEGLEAGPEADVFSLGTILYLFATTRLPFTAPNTTATLKKILDGVYEDPRQLVPTISDDFAEVIATCLMRQPNARYPNAGKLRYALDEYLSSVGFPRVGEELGSFFADPPSYRKQMVKKLTAALVLRGEGFILEKRPAKALSCLNQVLAHDSGNTRALELLHEMNIARKRQRTAAAWLRAAVATGVLAVAGGGGWLAYSLLTLAPDFYPELALRGPEVPVPASVYPKPPAPVLPEAVAIGPGPSVVSKEAAGELPRNGTSTDPSKGPEKGPKKENPKVALALAAPELLDVAINIRPFGLVQVDGGKSSAEELARHELRLPAGRHEVAVSCSRFCDPEPVRKTIEVAAGEKNEVNVPVLLKRSMVAFDGFPPEATASVRGESRAVRDTRENPFVVARGPAREAKMAHVVEYEVSLKGYKTETGTAYVTPGEVVTIRGSLSPE
ncbi:MAG: serine/threonine protein kinase [Myxococcales bacterium]|nr:serine/threonine protein kinase [Myxococcales bacterium]